MQAQLPGRSADGNRIEVGRLDQHVAGRFRDFRRRPAHHAADGHRHASVGNHAHVRVKTIGLVVDGLDRLTGEGTADDDLRAVEFRIVERVQRLPAFHHHVVRDIDHVVDQPNADRRQTIRQPIGTWPHADAANHPRRVARAQIGAIDAHADEVFHSRLAFRRTSRGDRQGAIPQHGNFPRDADMAQAIGPVAGHLQIDGQIVADLMRLLVVQPGHHQPLLELPRRHGQGNVLLQPVPGDEHFGIWDLGFGIWDLRFEI